MSTVKTSHAHSFASSDWPFADSENTAAMSTRRVFYEDFPVLLVSHDEEGDWQVLCGTTTEFEQAMVVCLGCAYQHDPTIGELADLPLGWCASRASTADPWVRRPKELND